MTEREKKIKDAIDEREVALTDLWIAVMNQYNQCPPEVKDAWDKANKASNDLFMILRNKL